MAQIKIELSAPPVDGMDIKFQAPCDCTAITGMVLHYPAEDGSTATKDLTFRDAHGNNLAGIGNLFAQGAYVKVIVDVKNGYAYLQNADNNAFLNAGIFGTYIHDGGDLTGYGDNGKFKAAASGTISTINVNGVSCSVKCGEESSMDLIAGCWYTFILDGDTVNFNSGGAGGGLNFKVVGGTSEPVSPKENTIWIDTDDKIIGWIFSATQPETAEEGMAWICTVASGNTEFDALKKNSMIICPIRARQYIGGAWVERDAEIYQSGAWKPIIGTKYLFKQGDGAVAPLATSAQSYLFSVTVSGEHIYGYGYAHSDSNVNVSVYTESETDLTGYTTLCFDIEIPTGTITFGVSRDPMVANNPANMPFVAKQQVGVCSRQTIRVDISGVDKGYLGACGCGNYYIYNWWYE